MEFDTKSIHSGYTDEFTNKSTITPIYENASFAYKNPEELEDVFAGKKFGFIYSRISNPTVSTFERKIADLEEGIGAVATSSGMAAITTAILALTESNDEIISAKSLFGGTLLLFNNVISKYNVKIKYADTTDINSYKKLITPKTKLIFLETIGNPKLDVPNIKEISEISHKNNLPLIVDSTLTTPYLFKAKKLGVDIVIHSTTKYITGNGTAIGGILIDTGLFNWVNTKSEKVKKLAQKAGELAFLSMARSEILQNVGFAPSPFNIFLSNLGVETLSLRMEKHCENALQLAEFLKENKKIKKVNYPGLKESKFYEIAKAQFNNKFGGILTFELPSKIECFNFIKNLRLAKNLANLGDTRTLVIHPESTIYHNCSIDEKKSAGVNDRMIRVSVGIENIKDIIEDFENALKSI